MSKYLIDSAALNRRAFAVRLASLGTPTQTIKRATELAESFGTDEITFVFEYGGMPMAQAEKSMRLFAREVMPALRELQPRPIG